MVNSSNNESPVSVVMVRPDLRGFPVHDIPAPFACRRYRSGDDRVWTGIVKKSELWLNIDAGTFRREFGEDDNLISERMFFLLDETSRPVATSTAWFDNDRHRQGYGRVHWVAVIPEKQGCNLGKALMTLTLNGLRQSGHKRAVLGTHAVRIPAINLYLYFGFQPEISDDRQLLVWRKLRPQLKYPVEIPS